MRASSLPLTLPAVRSCMSFMTCPMSFLVEAPVSREVTELSKERGQYDGLVYRDNALYYSDWSKDKKPEAVRRLDLKTGRSAPVATGPVEGAADFILYDSMMVVPGMTEKKIHIMPIGGKK